MAPLPSQLLCPVKALSPIYRALFKEDMRHAGLLEHIDPRSGLSPGTSTVRPITTATPPSPYLAPSVFKVAISNHRLVSLTDRTVTFTYRKVGSARLRTTHLDVMEFLRRFLQHVLPTAS